MSDFKQRINRFVELDAKATPGPWEYDTHESSHTGEICGYMTKPDIEDMLSGKDCDMDLSVAFRNDGLPLLKEMQAEIDRLKCGIGRAVQNLEASDLIDLVHSAINDRYEAAKACVEKGLRELEALK